MAVFFTLFLTRITPYKTGFFQYRAQLRVKAYERLGNTMANCTGLADNASAGDLDRNVELLKIVGQAQGLGNNGFGGVQPGALASNSRA